MHDRICPECDASFSPRYGSQVCCSDECQKIRERRLIMEAKRKKREREREDRQARQERREMKRRLKERDERYPQPKIEIVERDGVVTERRGRCVGTAAGAIDTSVIHAMAFI